jgi:hypothetical protein
MIKNNFKYQKKTSENNFDKTIKIKTQCGEEVEIFLNIIKNNNIKSVCFNSSGSQLISIVLEKICELIDNKNIDYVLIHLEVDFWKDFSLNVSGSRKEMIEGLVVSIKKSL